MEHIAHNKPKELENTKKNQPEKLENTAKSQSKKQENAGKSQSKKQENAVKSQSKELENIVKSQPKEQENAVEGQPKEQEDAGKSQPKEQENAVESQLKERENEGKSQPKEQENAGKGHGKERENTEENQARKIEKSIQKKFHKELFSRFAKAVRDYELVQEGDKIAVCISGGKDSMLMAKLFQELQKHRKVSFGLEFLVMDPGYVKENRKKIESNAANMGVPITIFETDIFEAVYDIEKSPCYLCARMRRGHLYHQAGKLGCNKIALGHHYDDVIETILMGMLYGGQVQTMMPKLHSTNFPGMELIRPMYYIREADIRHWRDYHGLEFLQCACRFTESCAAQGIGVVNPQKADGKKGENGSCAVQGTGAANPQKADGAEGESGSCAVQRADHETTSKRLETKRLIAELKKTNPFVEANIFRSVENVNLNTVIAYKEQGKKHHFLDQYDG